MDARSAHFIFKSMKKLYKNRRPSTNILVTVNGAVRSIEFTPDVIFDWGLRGCSYITEDKDIQTAIENHPFFSENASLYDRIWTDDKEPEVKKEKEEVVEKPKRTVRRAVTTED